MQQRVDVERNFWDSFAGRYDRFIDRRLSVTYTAIVDRLHRDTEATKELLELGTGTGIIALQLHDRVPRITATDISPEMIRIAEEKRRRQEIENVRFRVGDCCELDFPDRSFDTVIASNVLHLLMRPDLAMQEMYRILKEGGRLIVPTYCHGDSLKSHLFSRLMGTVGFRARTRWSIQSFRNFIKQNGFQINRDEIFDDIIPMVYPVAIKRSQSAESTSGEANDNGENV